MWSMRTPPAWRRAARRVARNGSKPRATSACGEKPVRPQSWPRGLKMSGGAPTDRPSSRSDLPRPGVAAGAVHADRQIADQADAHAGRPRRRLGGGEGACGEPLQEQVVAHRRGLALEIGRDRRVARMTPALLPVAPVARMPGMQRFEQRVLAQGRAALAHEALEVGGQRRSGGKIAGGEIVVQAAQQGELRRTRRRPIDQRRLFQSLAPGRCTGSDPVGAEDDGRIGVERIEEQPARRRIRAVTRRVGGEQAMHRAQRHGIGALARRCLGKIAHRAGIADAAVAGAAQAVDLGGDAPHPAAGADFLEGDAARRRHGERDLAVGEAQAVVARLADGGHGRGLAASDRHRPDAAVLQRQFGRRVGLDRQVRQGDARIDPRGDERRHAPDGLAFRPATRGSGAAIPSSPAAAGPWHRPSRRRGPPARARARTASSFIPSGPGRRPSPALRVVRAKPARPRRRARRRADGRPAFRPGRLRAQDCRRW